MKKILLSLLVIAAITAAISGGTLAYFSATATSSANTFAAGTLSFVIKSPTASSNQIFNVSNMKPGQTVTACVAVANDSTTGMGEKFRAYLTNVGGTGLGDVLTTSVTMHPSTGCDAAYTATAGYTQAGPPDYNITTDATLATLSDPDTTPLVWAGPATPLAFEPTWAAVYRVDVTMAASADSTYMGKTFTADMLFQASQYENPGW